MIKVPATPEGIPAIEELIADGVNVNITLMFSMSHYEAVARAYISGLERCADPSKVASVASFFVSRVDTMVDKALEDIGTRRKRRRCWAKSLSPIPRWFTTVSWRSFTARALRRCASAARGCNGRYGPAQGRKIPPIPMCFMLKTSSALKRSIRCRRIRINAFRDHGKIPGKTVRESLDEAEDRARAVGSSASISTQLRRSCSRMVLTPLRLPSIS